MVGAYEILVVGVIPIHLPCQFVPKECMQAGGFFNSRDALVKGVKNFAIEKHASFQQERLVTDGAGERDDSLRAADQLFRRRFGRQQADIGQGPQATYLGLDKNIRNPLIAYVFFTT